MNVITLVRGRDVWEAVYSGPHAVEVKRLFGTVRLPTPFADPARAIAAIRAGNPGTRVEIIYPM